MAIVFNCLKCGVANNAPDKDAGEPVPCGSCGYVMQVPKPVVIRQPVIRAPADAVPEVAITTSGLAPVPSANAIAAYDSQRRVMIVYWAVRIAAAVVLIFGFLSYNQFVVSFNSTDPPLRMTVDELAKGYPENRYVELTDVFVMKDQGGLILPSKNPGEFDGIWVPATSVVEGKRTIGEPARPRFLFHASGLMRRDEVNAMCSRTEFRGIISSNVRSLRQSIQQLIYRDFPDFNGDFLVFDVDAVPTSRTTLLAIAAIPVTIFLVLAGIIIRSFFVSTSPEEVDMQTVLQRPEIIPPVHSV